jgi:YgiT-type zinc finger domain-containing protein
MCTFCGGSLKESQTEYIEKQGNYLIVIGNVPCEECTQCGETYFNTEVVKTIESILNNSKAVSDEITVSMIDYNNKVA